MAPATATTEVTTADTSDNKPQEQAKVLDYNPRGKGYIYIAFTSLVCFASVCNVKKGRNEYSISLAIGAVTFGLSVFILLLDRAQGCFESFKFHKSMDGKLEGFTLLFFVIWWVIGVCIMTQSGGIAYSAINVYFSSWLALGACCYTLNDWSGSKDIITIQELTALSMTLRGWYGLLFSSIVVMGSASDMHRFLISDGPTQEASFAIALGIISLIVSAMCILAHYRVLPFPPVGGFIELSITSILIILWILGYDLSQTLPSCRFLLHFNLHDTNSCSVFCVVSHHFFGKGWNFDARRECRRFHYWSMCL